MTSGLLTPSHLMLLLIVVLIVLGPKRLPQAGRSLGRGMREFKEAITGHDTSEQTQPLARPTRPRPGNAALASGEETTAAEPASTPASEE